jgi:hypothetical protein
VKRKKNKRIKNKRKEKKGALVVDKSKVCEDFSNYK